MVFEIRPEALDAPNAQRLLAEFGAGIVELYPGWGPGVGPTANPQEFVPPAGLFVVAYTEDGDPVGCGGVKRLDDHTGEIKRVYVASGHRGAGLSRQILHALEDAARGAGYTHTRLDTGNRQPDAVALFESSGYIKIDDYNGNPVASYWYEKDLT